MTSAPLLRRSRTLIVLLALLAPLFVQAPADAATSESDLERLAEQLFLDAHLDVRENPSAHGVGDHPATSAIEGHTDILDVSRAWATQMARDGRMSHNPSFGDQLCCWTRVGENVARYSADIRTEDDVRRAVDVLMRAWINSDGHRANIMDARWDQFAVGVDLHAGTLWATANFRTLEAGATPPGHPYGQDGGFEAQQAEARPAPEARDISTVCADADHAGYDDTRGIVHEDAIRCASALGLAKGRGDGQYAPSADVSRAQVVLFVHRAVTESGHPLSWDGVDHFSDDDGTHYEQAANELASAGWLVTGSDTVAGNTQASRAFIADVAGRVVADLAGTTPTEDWFADDDGLREESRINVLAEAGVVTGNGKGSYGPEQGLSRAQVATVLVRMFDALGA